MSYNMSKGGINMQKITKKLTRSIALAMSIVMISATAIFASPMKDVSPNHWAYNDIVEMQRRGLLLTNSKGEFFPNQYVTYFEFSQILAKVTGYEDELVNPNMDPNLKKNIRDNYEKQKPIIESHAKNYKHWQHDTNKEIAYLLGRGYLTKEDLGKFMSKSTSGMESKRGVRKQEATVYLVRILHKAETAKKEYTSTGFKDEAQIDASYRPYVAYMKSLGIVNGDQNGEFGPAQPVTRATLSKMLVDTLRIMEAEENKPPVETDPPADKAIEGKIQRMISRGDDSYYLVIEVEPGQTQNYTIKSSASIADKAGNGISLSNLKAKIDNKGSQDIVITARVEVIENTEYITDLKIITELAGGTVDEPEEEITEPKEDEKFTGSLKGGLYSVLIGPESAVKIQLANGELKEFKIDFNSKIYSHIDRKNISLWDLRLNQEIEVKIVDDRVESVTITKEAPPVTLNGKITDVSVSGDQIDMYVTYSSLGQGANIEKTINVPIETRVIEGTRERSRKDLKEGMEIVVIYEKSGDTRPERIIILSK